MKKLKLLLTIGLLYLIPTTGYSQTILSEASSSPKNPNFEATVRNLIQTGKYFIGDAWNAKMVSADGEVHHLKITFLDANQYEAGIESRNYPNKSWTGNWTWSPADNLLTLKNFQDGKPWQLKISKITLATFDANQTIHFTKGDSEKYNVSPAGNTNVEPVTNPLDLDKRQIVGTWHILKTEMWATTEYYFSIYPDDRVFMIATVLPYPCNGTYKIDGAYFIPTWDEVKFLGPLQTISINANTWVFLNLETNEKFTAQKTSNVPVPIPQKDGNGNIKNPPSPQSSTINPAQLLGTWKAVSSTGVTFYYTIYPDQRMYHCYGYNGNWTLAGDKFFSYWDGRESPTILKIHSFSTANWVYEGISDGVKYTATKIADVPLENLRSKCQPPPAPVCSKCGLSAGHCKCNKGSACVCCSGKGNQACGSCNGSGSREVVESDGRGGFNTHTTSCGVCYNGRETCWCCSGSGKQ